MRPAPILDCVDTVSVRTLRIMDRTELNQTTLGQITDDIAVPEYDRSALARSIVHIGVGGFHRAHLAVYVDELARKGHTDWGIVGSGVMAGDARMRDALQAQDMLFTVVARGADELDMAVIGSHLDYVLAADDPQPLIDLIAADSTEIVSLTVTEGGYPVDDATGAFDATSPNAAPGSAFSAMIGGLKARMDAGGKPLTIMSCDNVMGNGDVAKLSVTTMAAAHGDAFVSWINEHVSFPNSMVDRITPATTENDIAWLADTHGLVDQWPVVCEPFIQWVIEDNYAGARPPWEELDVIITNDVRPYEHMKLQLLNAGHAVLGFAGHLFEIELAHDGMADPDVLCFIEAFLHREAKTSLHPVDGMDFDTYIDSLLKRFANPEVKDQILRLGMDGTSRLPKFILPTLRTHLANGGPTEMTALFLATWCQALTGVSDAGNPIEYGPDPLLEDAKAAAQASFDNPAAFLELAPIFDGIRDNEAFAEQFADALTNIRAHGLRAAIQSAVATG